MFPKLGSTLMSSCGALYITPQRFNLQLVFLASVGLFYHLNVPLIDGIFGT